MARQNWTRNELIIAFNLYCKIPFGRIHTRNPEIIALANALGRTPSAVSWKLANFARLDPALKRRDIAGAVHGARAERDVWEEFHGNWEKLAFESERLLAKTTGREFEPLMTVETFPEGAERDRTVRVRVNQAFFRAAVLAAYNSKCCITGLGVVQLLNASHIVPWARDMANRTNPQNGLCLNAIHDRAFDCGLMTVTPEYRVKVSRSLSRGAKDRALVTFLLRYDGRRITLPERFQPDPVFLQFHQANVFIAGLR